MVRLASTCLGLAMLGLSVDGQRVHAWQWTFNNSGTGWPSPAFPDTPPWVGRVMGVDSIAAIISDERPTALADRDDLRSISVVNRGYIELRPLQILGGAMSVCGWVKYRNFGSDRYSRIIGLGNGAEYENIYVTHRERGPDLKFSIRQGTDSRALYVGNFWDLNTWQHFCVTVNDDGLKTAFKNGQQRGECSSGCSGGGGHAPVQTTLTTNFIGKSNWDSDALLNGMICDLRIYDGVALTADQVTEIMAGGLGWTTPPTTALPTTAAPTTAVPTSLAPTPGPTSGPTFHPCTDGTHSCDPATAYCAVHPGVPSGFTCECNQGLTRVTATQCWLTANPTPGPSLAPTANRTGSPTAVPSSSMPTTGAPISSGSMLYDAMRRVELDRLLACNGMSGHPSENDYQLRRRLLIGRITQCPTNPPSTSPTSSPAVGAGSTSGRSADGGDGNGDSDGTIVVVIVVGLLLIVAVVGGAVVYVKKGAARAHPPPSAFENPAYADSNSNTLPSRVSATLSSFSMHSGSDITNNTSGYVDIPAPAPNQGYMDVAADDSEDV